MNHAPLPKENFADLAADLAMIIADTIEHPDCPIDLRDSLTETIDDLQNAIGPSCSELLRALAGLAKQRDSRTRVTSEKSILGDVEAVLSRPSVVVDESQALAASMN